MTLTWLCSRKRCLEAGNIGCGRVLFQSVWQWVLAKYHNGLLTKNVQFTFNVVPLFAPMSAPP